MNKKPSLEEAQKAGGKKYRDMVKKGLDAYKKLPEEKKHMLHVYYGYGKGKSTAVVGLIIRTLGAGKRAAMVQFDKGYDGKREHYNERHLFRKLKELGYPLEIYPTGCERMNEDGTFRFKNADVDFEEAGRGLQFSRTLIKEGKQNLLVLDEILAAVAYHLIEEKDVMELISLYDKKPGFELVLTGHKLFKSLEERADLVTEMRKVKHYFDKGIQAREGIEF